MRFEHAPRYRKGRRPFGVMIINGAEGDFFMNELHVLYTFLALMTFNFFAVLVYILSFNSRR